VEAKVDAPVLLAPAARRRAVFKWDRGQIGFFAAKSHSIVDMRECRVVIPEIFALVQALRQRLDFLRGPTEIHVTASLTGFDLAFRSTQKISPALAVQMAKAAVGLHIARIIFNNRLLLETAIPQVEEGGVRVNLPPHAFLQSSLAAEAESQQRVLEIARRTPAKRIVDLFAGLGTFALPLARTAKVHAVEQNASALAALAEAAKGPGLKPVSTEVRDLFKLPLSPSELNAHDMVVLDPPRAGALAQIQALARSEVPAIAYVSCDAESFARDAALLVAAGYEIGTITPIDQFLWSSHIELVAGFARSK
jgi:23S rRNA (uracil1939-C5)-methyltransferase